MYVWCGEGGACSNFVRILVSFPLLSPVGFRKVLITENVISNNSGLSCHVVEFV